MPSRKILGVIPARWASTYLPGKPLVDLCGKPMIQHVWERAFLSGSLYDLVVATDDHRVYNVVKEFGGEAVMTSPEHPSSASRVEEAVRGRGVDADAVIAIQGDEPLLDPLMIDEIAETLNEPDVNFATLARPFTDDSDQADPNVVKVVLSQVPMGGERQEEDALIFSRTLIPNPRSQIAVPVYRHIGIYGYTVTFLQHYVELPPTPLSEAESLEQLKALEYGYKIRVRVSDSVHPSRTVETLDDVDVVRKIMIDERESVRH